MPKRPLSWLLAVFAHPDDESLAAGGLLAHFAALGIETHLIVTTAAVLEVMRGERPHHVGTPP